MAQALAQPLDRLQEVGEQHEAGIARQGRAAAGFARPRRRPGRGSAGKLSMPKRPVAGRSPPPSSATRSPPRTRSAASASVSRTARSHFRAAWGGERNAIERERSHQIQTLSAASHSCSRTNRWRERADWRQSISLAASPVW